MKTKFILIELSVCFCLGQCHFSMEEVTYPWYVQNNASYSIGTYFAFGCYDFSLTAYPDTTIQQDSVMAMVTFNKKLEVWRSPNREKLIKSLPSDTLSIFIFHVDILNRYTWEDIRQNYRILKRYDLSLKDLQKLDYTVPYPPTEMMKDMKMYPPYGAALPLRGVACK